MKITIGFCAFCDAFRDADRNDNFTYAGKRALFDYLEEYEESTGEEVELDVIALCCEYSELELDEVIDYYRIDVSNCADDDEKMETVEAYLQENTSLVSVIENRFLFADF